MKTSTVVAGFATLAAGAAAQRTSPLGPTNYYPAAPGLLIGSANLSVICNITAYNTIHINNQELTAIFQIVAPNYGTFGGKSFVEGGNGRVRVPPSLTTFFGSLGINAFQGKFTQLNINAPGTTQKVVDLAKAQSLVIPNTTVTSGQDLFLDIPSKGSFRVTIQHDNKSPIISASIGDVNVNGTAYSTMLGTVPTVINCPAAKSPVTIGFISVQKNVTTPIIPTTSYPVVQVPKGALVGVAGATFRCNASGIGNFDAPAWVSGYVANLSATAGSKVAISNAHGQLNLTSAFLAAIKKANPTATAATVTLSSLRFRAQNASPALANGLKTGVTSSSFPLSGSVATVDLPSGNGLLPDIPFTLANKPGQLALTFLNDAAGTINLQKGSSALKTVPFSCAAPSPEAGLFSFNIL